MDIVCQDEWWLVWQQEQWYCVESGNKMSTSWRWRVVYNVRFYVHSNRACIYRVCHNGGPCTSDVKILPVATVTHVAGNNGFLSGVGLICVDIRVWTQMPGHPKLRLQSNGPLLCGNSARFIEILQNCLRLHTVYPLQVSLNTPRSSPSWEANRFSASQEITHFCGIRRFITALTRAHHLPYPEPDRSYPCAPLPDSLLEGSV